jgi:hypothetical protein
MTGAMGGFGAARSKREAIDVPEPKAPDRTLDRLLGVRKHRLERLERESLAARDAWRGHRIRLGDTKRSWREACLHAQEFWRQARARYFAMESSSGEFGAAKSGFNRLKREAAQVLLSWRETRAACETAQREFFAARERLAQARRQQEKLGMFRDEMVAASRVSDD